MGTIDDQIRENEQGFEQWRSALQAESARKASAFDELREVRAKEEMDKANSRIATQDGIEAAIANTPSGGSLSAGQVKYMNDTRGIDSRNGVANGQIMEAGYNPKTGGYGFVIARTNPDGSIGYVNQEIPRTEIYGMMRNRPEWFSPEQVNEVGVAIQDVDSSFTQSRLDQLASVHASRRQTMKDDVDRATSIINGYRSRSGSGALTFDQQMALVNQKEKARALYKNGGRGSSSSDGSGSGRFSSDQVQYFVNKQQQLMDERSRLDPRKAEDQKRIAEIDDEILDAKAYERIASRQGLKIDGQNIVLPQQTAKPTSDPALGIIGKHTENPEQKQQKRGYPDEQKAEVKEADEYTTRLDENEESSYQAWRSKQPKNLQYEGDYDLRGYYQDMKKNGKLPDVIGTGDHLPDTYKKPNHKTFSVESKYATGENAKKAGHWEGDKFVPARSEGLAYKDLVFNGKYSNDANEKFLPSSVLDTSSRSSFGRTGMRAMTDEESEAYDAGKKTYLNASRGVLRTPEERVMGDAAKNAMMATSFAMSGRIGDAAAALTSIGVSAPSVRRISNGEGTADDAFILATSLLSSGVSVKRAAATIRKFGMEINDAALKRASESAKSGEIAVGSSRKIPKMTKASESEKTGFSNSDTSLAYTRLNKSQVKSLVEDGYVRGEWSVPQKVGKGTVTVFDNSVGKLEGSGTKGEFGNAIVTVKKEFVGNGKSAPKLSDLDGIWVNKGGKKVNILPDILKRHRQSASVAKRIGNTFSEIISRRNDAKVTNKMYEFQDRVIAEVNRRTGRKGELPKEMMNRIRSRMNSDLRGIEQDARSSTDLIRRLEYDANVKWVADGIVDKDGKFISKDFSKLK